MKRFQLPPKGSTIYAELLKGRICCRTGHSGRATILFEHHSGEFVVMQNHEGRQYRFQNYYAAIRYFNICVGRVKALHGQKKRPEISL